MKESEAIKLPCPMKSKPMIVSSNLYDDGERKNTIELFEVMCNGSKCPVWDKWEHESFSDNKTTVYSKGLGECGLIKRIIDS